MFQRGETQTDKESGYERVPVHACPTVLKAVVYSLKPRVNDSVPNGFRLATKLGAVYLKALPETRQVDELKLTLQDPSVPLSRYTKGHQDWDYVFQQENLLTSGRRRFNVNTFGWVHGLIGDLAAIYGVSMSRVAGLALVAAVSRSDEWVRQDVVAACQEEIVSFRFCLRYHYGLPPAEIDEAAGR
jgi:hypothetical protein